MVVNMTAQALRNFYKTQGYVLLFKTFPENLPNSMSNVGFAFSSKTAYRIESLVKFYLDESSFEESLLLKAILSKSNSFSAEIKKNNNPLIYSVNVDFDLPGNMNSLSLESAMAIKNIFKSRCLATEFVKTKRYGVNMEISENLNGNVLIEKDDTLTMAFLISQSCQELAYYDAVNQETIILEKLK